MSSAVTAGNFLGVTPVLQTISPSIYPLRTALDVLQPHGFRYGLPFQGFYPQYPVQYPTFLTVRSPFINTFPSTLTPIRTVEQPKEVTEVVEEEEVAEEPSAAVGEITIREHIDALPSLPSSPFRDANPVIPAGIAQATQPQFTQTIFKVGTLLAPYNVHSLFFCF